MEFPIYELSDGRFLGVSIFEILSFPNGDGQEKNRKAFFHILTELYKLSGNDCVWEFLWIPEETPHQTFLSRVRIFGILRKIGRNAEEVESVLRNIHTNLQSSLAVLQYHLGTVNMDDSHWKDLLKTVDDSCLYAIVKGEKCAGNAYSPYAYYFCDIVPRNNEDNFEGLLSVLSRNKNCCVSFQFLPTVYTQEESFTLNEMSAELGRISGGFSLNGQMIRDETAAVPRQIYEYYKRQNSAPLFLYNFLVFGKRDCCSGIAVKLVSLLQSGDASVEEADFACYDLSGEKINPEKQFLYYPWNVNMRLLHYYRNQRLLGMLPLAKKMYRLPYLMSAEEAVSVFRLPLYEKNLAMIQNNQILQTREQLSSVVVNQANIQLGRLITVDDSQIMIGCPEKYFTRHALIVGKPGQGKTTFMMDLLLQFAEKNIPFLAVEPTKAEYRAMIDAIPDLQIFTPGNNEVSPYIVNPFIPPRGIRVEQYIPSLISAFAAAFDMDGPLEMLFLKAVRTCYMRYGWKDYSKYGDADIKVFGMYEFILVFKGVMDNMGYAREVKQNIESAGLLRLMNLIEQNSNIYDSIHTIPLEDLLSAPTILELNAIDNEEQKSLIMALLLINICVYTKNTQVQHAGLRNVILIDEAHVLLEGKQGGIGKNADSSGKTIQTLRNMIVEIRAYGTGILIADQMPSRVGKTIVANTDIKVCFQLVEGTEKELIADSTDMDEEMRARISKLRVGEAYVHYGQLDTPQLVRCRDIRKEKNIRNSVSDTEVAERMVYWEKHKQLLKPYLECMLCEYCGESCDLRLRAKADYIAGKALYQYRSFLTDESKLKKCVYHLPNLLKEEFESQDEKDIRKLQICTRIKLVRKACMELPISLECDKIGKLITELPEETKQTGEERTICVTSGGIC